jgi:GNAT superfamily N-acetyltransferase
MNQLEFHPATAEHWKDLEALFGERGAYGNCWCMWWRMKRSEFDKQPGRAKKQALKDIVDTNQVPGILAFANGEPIAWCSVAPRETFASLERSQTLKRVDEEPVWSIVCFFVAKPYRRQGLMAMLLRAAIDYAKANGAKIVGGWLGLPGACKMVLPVCARTGS